MKLVIWETVPPNSPMSSVVIGYIYHESDTDEFVYREKNTDRTPRFVLIKDTASWNWSITDVNTNHKWDGFLSLESAISFAENHYNSR